MPCITGLALLGMTAAAPAEDAILVSTQPLERVAIQPTHSAPATAVSLNDARLSAEINARILRIPVRVGQQVQSGATLVELDCRQYELRLDRARTQYEVAAKQLKRARRLSSEKNISEELVNQRESEFAAAKAELGQARLDVGHCSVSAPFDGVVTQRLAAEGELAAPGTPLLQIIDRGRLELSAQVQESQAASLQAAPAPHFEHLGNSYPVTLARLTPAVDPLTRNREVRLRFTGQRPLPGSAGRLVWRSPRQHLPADLVVQRDGDFGVMVADASHARFIALPDAVEGQPAPIELPPASAIIVDGRYTVRDGDPIRTE